MSDDRPALGVRASGRKAGKRTAIRHATVDALRRGEHVHLAEDGTTYCLNAICTDLPADHPDYRFDIDKRWDLDV